MGSKSIALDILEEDVFFVHNYKEHFLNTNNGILNEENLEYEKRELLKNSLSYLVAELVTHKQGYPHDDISKVELDTDFVILKREDFDKLKRCIEDE